MPATMTEVTTLLFQVGLFSSLSLSDCQPMSQALAEFARLSASLCGEVVLYCKELKPGHLQAIPKESWHTNPEFSRSCKLSFHSGLSNLHCVCLTGTCSIWGLIHSHALCTLWICMCFMITAASQVQSRIRIGVMIPQGCRLRPKLSYVQCGRTGHTIVLC